VKEVGAVQPTTNACVAVVELTYHGF
jgi:hypothetical protein